MIDSCMSVLVREVYQSKVTYLVSTIDYFIMVTYS